MKKENEIICPPRGENVGLPTKRGAHKAGLVLPLLSRLTAVLPPQGREMSRGFTLPRHAELVSASSCYDNNKPLNQIQGDGIKGFTLIELLVVVLIIGILATVALPQYQKAVYKSRYIQLQVLVDAIAKAQEEVYLATGTYTIDPDELSVSMPQPNSIDDTKTGKKVYNYVWGYCNFAAFGVSCNNDDIALYYEKNYVHTSYEHAGVRECGVLDTSNSYALNICKQVTHKQEPDWQSGSYASFYY